MSFPENFLWGGDISATQCEGAWDVDGRSPTETDFMTPGSAGAPRYVTYIDRDGNKAKMPVMITGDLPEGARYALFDNEVYPNHYGNDFYHHYKEDIALFGKMGFKTLNLSVSWARILPYGRKNGVNEKGIQFYKNVFAECRKYGIKPLIILYKYDMPVYYIETFGGWKNRDMVDEFAYFAEVCFRNFREDADMWVTFNEINVELLVKQMGNPTDEELRLTYTKLNNQLLASAKAVKIGHAINPANRIGCMNAGTFTYYMTTDPEDVYDNIRTQQNGFYYSADIFMRGTVPSYSIQVQKKLGTEFFNSEDRNTLQEGKADFLGFSYYSTGLTTTHRENAEKTSGNISLGYKNEYLKASDWGWQIDPVGLKSYLHTLYDRYQKPLMILENGLGAVDHLEDDGSIHDPYHVEYMREHIKEMKNAVEEGVDLIGYTMWSCIDLCAASTGELKKRYGFIYVDSDGLGNGTYTRYIKDSFYWYQKVIETNGEVL